MRREAVCPDASPSGTQMRREAGLPDAAFATDASGAVYPDAPASDGKLFNPKHLGIGAYAVGTFCFIPEASMGADGGIRGWLPRTTVGDALALLSVNVERASGYTRTSIPIPPGLSGRPYKIGGPSPRSEVGD